jgi:hypothetical protein
VLWLYGTSLSETELLSPCEDWLVLYCTHTTVIPTINQQYKYDTIATPQYNTNYKKITYLKEKYSYYILLLFLWSINRLRQTYKCIVSNNALGIMWNANLLAYFDVVSLHLPEVTE